jgi:hypothetical protein
MGSKADALERAMQPEQPEKEKTLWERLKALVSTSGTEWADNANALMPDEVSGRKAVVKRRKRDEMLDELNRSE